jgi:hypothetical protein
MSNSNEHERKQAQEAIERYRRSSASLTKGLEDTQKKLAENSEYVSVIENTVNRPDVFSQIPPEERRRQLEMIHTTTHVMDNMNQSIQGPSRDLSVMVGATGATATGSMVTLSTLAQTSNSENVRLFCGQQILRLSNVANSDIVFQETLALLESRGLNAAHMPGNDSPINLFRAA